MFVKEGDYVKEGTPLYQLRTTELQDELMVLTAQARSAQANFDKLREEPRPTDVAPLKEALEIQKYELQRLELELQRSEYLLKRNIVTPSSHDDLRELTNAQRHRVAAAERELEQIQAGPSKYLLEQAQAEIAVINGNIKAIQNRIEESTVRAPINGIVLSVNQHAGDYISLHNLSLNSQPNAPVVFGAQDMRLKVMISERDIGKIKPEMQGMAYRRENTSEGFPLIFSHIIPMMVPKKHLTGAATERVDARVMHVFFDFKSLPATCYSGELLDVFLDLGSPYSDTEAQQADSLPDSTQEVPEAPDPSASAVTP